MILLADKCNSTHVIIDDIYDENENPKQEALNQKIKQEEVRFLPSTVFSKAFELVENSPIIDNYKQLEATQKEKPQSYPDGIERKGIIRPKMIIAEDHKFKPTGDC